MKCIIPEISWHNRDPVLSIDIQVRKEGENLYRLATGGTDSHVLIWHMLPQNDGSFKLECVCDLTRHQKAVNAVKFSPSGEFLASGDDESAIIIWKMKTDQDAPDLDDEQVESREVWIQVKKQLFEGIKILSLH
ncbi:chromatin assembly factor 1 subunit B [Halyomorpha halys]|uniref:chromatin assembly factor 1 subunit B n=1 Tax=Halyomorpha halys TaxID=286706 RepID=UPI0006D4E5AB|nr:chromatin assembly factor 1 subunit B-like [Halyomorpha halys]